MTRRGWALFALLAVLWGLPYLFIRIAVEWLAPGYLVCLRGGLAALLLLPVALVRGELGRLRPYWRWVALFAAVEIGVPALTLNYAEQRLTSSLTALLMAAVPIGSAVVSRVLRLGERFDRRRWLGLLIGLAGVVALVGIDVGTGDLVAVAAAMVTVAGYALGPAILTLRLREAPQLGVTAASFALVAVVFAPWAWLSRPADVHAVPARVWLAVLILGVVCSALAFFAFISLIHEAGPARATVITYLNPAVAVLLGVLVLSEPFTWGLALGFPLVLLGSWLATSAKGTPQAVRSQRSDSPIGRLEHT